MSTRKNIYLQPTDDSLKRAEEMDKMAMEIMKRPEPTLAEVRSQNIDRAKRTIEAIEKMSGEKLNVVVVDGGEGIPQISMVRPFARPWLSAEQVKEWNDSHGVNLKTYDVESTVTPVGPPSAKETSSSTQRDSLSQSDSGS